jgi:hypothetical protein
MRWKFRAMKYGTRRSGYPAQRGGAREVGMFAAQLHHLPHRFHIAIGPAAVAAPSWLPVVVIAAAIFALGLWWASSRA